MNEVKAFLKSVPKGVWIILSVALFLVVWASYATGKVSGCEECKGKA